MENNEEKTYCLYDEDYLGTGFILIKEKDNEINKFIKITQSNYEGFPYFFIYTFSKRTHDKYPEEFRKMEFSVNKKENEELYGVIKTFSDLMNGRKIKTVNGDDRIIMSINSAEDIASINLFKDTVFVTSDNEYAHISLGGNLTCEDYNNILNFYNNLANITKEKSTAQVIRKMIKR